MWWDFRKSAVKCSGIARSADDQVPNRYLEDLLNEMDHLVPFLLKERQRISEIIKARRDV